MLACTQDEYRDRVLAGIVYTDEAYKEAALPVKAFSEKAGEELGKSFEEIVLTDYTEAQLIETDPRLIVLAPFTVSPEQGKTGVLSRGRRWKEEVCRVYPKHWAGDALNVMGLFIMNRFRDITREEVISMLNFDLMDTVAGQQIYEEGVEKGLEQGIEEGIEKGAIKDAREMVIEVLTERFVIISAEIKESVYSVGDHNILKALVRYAVRSSDIEDFKKVLSKISSAS